MLHAEDYGEDTLREHVFLSERVPAGLGTSPGTETGNAEGSLLDPWAGAVADARSGHVHCNPACTSAAEVCLPAP